MSGADVKYVPVVWASKDPCSDQPVWVKAESAPIQMQWILLAVRSNGQRECGEQQVEKMQSESGFLGGYII